MEDDLLSLPVGLSSKSLGIGGEGKNGKSDGEIPTKKFLRDFVFTPKVVNHNSNLGVKSRLQRGGDRGDKGKLMGDSIQDLDVQVEGFWFLRGLNRNGFPKGREASSKISFDRRKRKRGENLDLQRRLFPDHASLSF